MVYFPGGIVGAQFDLTPPSSAIRTVNQTYRLAGMANAEVPIGVLQRHTTHI